MYAVVISVEVQTLKTPTPKALIMRGHLPFVPVAGMFLVIHRPGDVSLRVDTVQWRKPIGKDGFFVVLVSDSYKNHTREQIRDAYKDDGWTIDVD